MRQELQAVFESLADLPTEDLPRLAGELAELQAYNQAHITMRLIMSAPAKVEDKLIGIDEAAERIGMSRDFIYQNADELPFVKYVGRSLRCSEQGLEKWMRKR